jgi:hypothetical protein
MLPTGERLGMSEFVVCLQCHPEYKKIVDDYANWNEQFRKKYLLVK